MKRVMVAMLASAVLAAGCGKSDEEKRAEQTAPPGGQAASGSQQVAEPVALQDLLQTLPQLDGWEQMKPEGERMTSPVPRTDVKANYIKPDASMDIEIVDSAYHPQLLAPTVVLTAPGYSKESTNGYEKSTTVNGHPGWERWDSEINAGELHALVGKRFLVSIEGDNIESVQVLKDIATKIDFSRLASLK